MGDLALYALEREPEYGREWTFLVILGLLLLAAGLLKNGGGRH